MESASKRELTAGVYSDALHDACFLNSRLAGSLALQHQSQGSIVHNSVQFLLPVYV